MTRMEFDQRMAAGLADAEAERGVEIEVAMGFTGEEIMVQ